MSGASIAVPISDRPPRSRSHALKGASHTSPGCNPGNPPGKTTPRSEGTPHRRAPRALDLDPALLSGLSSLFSGLIPQPFYPAFLPRPSLCGVPSEHTYSLGGGSQGVALGWYALPPSGQMEQRRFRYRASHHVSDTAPGPRFRHRIAHHVSDTAPRPQFRYRASHHVFDTAPRSRFRYRIAHHVPDPMP